MKCYICERKVTKQDIEKNLSLGFEDVCCEKCWKENDERGRKHQEERGIHLYDFGAIVDLDKFRELSKTKSGRKPKRK